MPVINAPLHFSFWQFFIMTAVIACVHSKWLMNIKSFAFSNYHPDLFMIRVALNVSCCLFVFLHHPITDISQAFQQGKSNSEDNLMCTQPQYDLDLDDLPLRLTPEEKQLLAEAGVEGLDDTESDMSFAARIQQLTITDESEGKGHYGVIGHDGVIYNYEGKDGGIHGDEVKGEIACQHVIIHQCIIILDQPFNSNLRP